MYSIIASLAPRNGKDFIRFPSFFIPFRSRGNFLPLRFYLYFVSIDDGIL
ncbi:hypothetical protein HMPREF3293_01625 [Christensenella minuta]|uniref:Uncharacterized protein n=1 Tax=Christensenella minuta TaxID=626937 RepID=A0A136Q3Z2_9FIRM|nr:hypothetical protein HMPREF3293_01625 [Christensenella minuta]